MIGRAALAFAAVGTFGFAAPPARATIVDDINPVGATVAVTVVQSGPSLSGRVRVDAIVHGKPATGYGTFKLAPGGAVVVEVELGGPVDEVIVVGITEGPDPIPD